MDIEFTDIDEGNTTEEVQLASPRSKAEEIAKRRHTVNIGVDFAANANLKRAVMALHKN